MILDACLVPALVPSEDTISGCPPFERGFEIKSSSKKRIEHVFAGPVCVF